MRAVALGRPAGRQLMSCLLRPATCGPTWLQTNRHVCLWHKADVQTALMNVRFEGNNGVNAYVTRCLVMIAAHP